MSIKSLEYILFDADTKMSMTCLWPDNIKQTEKDSVAISFSVTEI